MLVANTLCRFFHGAALIHFSAISCSKLTLQSEDNCKTIEDPKILSTSAPASTNCLLGNFEESVLNGRIEPVGVVEGFTVEIGAGGTFCPKHVTLPVIAYFFQLSDDNAPSPYLGYVNLEPLGRRGYHIPRTGTVQVTLFNPNKTVVKMFVVMYDLSDMPANCQTFLRQRTMYTPVDTNSSDPSYLRYLIHLRFQSSKSGKIYLHTDIRLIFARDKFEFDPQVANYELRSFTEGPENPKFSPKR
ncbi:atos homolog protein A-like [Mercenaria mercenaria]|uniref:atos homolog protein A-like n=1 Tax=Mercenaria mercenaria TaxID=6596 RepID=UPI00234E911C|nr:atos homolog protein A-like [Mercenaria mercenaria]